MRSIAWLSEKGGTGKTTSAINTAAALAKRGYRTLLIDADPQSNASLVLLSGELADPPTLAHVMLARAEVEDTIRPTRFERLDVLPSDASLADVNVILAGELGRERRLRLALERAGECYDFVIVDTSPQRSLINVNVLNSVAEVLVPVDPSVFSLHGLARLQDAVAEVVRYLDNRRLRISGLVLTRCQANNVSRDVETQLRGLMGELVYRTTIPHSIKVEEAHSRFLPVIDYAPRTAGAKAYIQLVEEMVHGEARERSGRTAVSITPAIGTDTAA